jgi:hypothetical protein
MRRRERHIRRVAIKTNIYVYTLLGCMAMEKSLSLHTFPMSSLAHDRERREAMQASISVARLDRSPSFSREHSSSRASEATCSALSASFLPSPPAPPLSSSPALPFVGGLRVVNLPTPELVTMPPATSPPSSPSPSPSSSSSEASPMGSARIGPAVIVLRID